MQLLQLYETASSMTTDKTTWRHSECLCTWSRKTYIYNYWPSKISKLIKSPPWRERACLGSTVKCQSAEGSPGGSWPSWSAWLQLSRGRWAPLSSSSAPRRARRTPKARGTCNVDQEKQFSNRDDSNKYHGMKTTCRTWSETVITNSACYLNELAEHIYL